MEILKGRGASQLWNSEGMGAYRILEFPSVVGHGYFLELPNRNTSASFGELEKAVETLACGTCSHSISRSP